MCPGVDIFLYLWAISNLRFLFVQDVFNLTIYVVVVVVVYNLYDIVL